jgi:hypothetical protein
VPEFSKLLFCKILQPESFNAGKKPLDDVNTLLERRGFEPIRMDRGKSLLQRFLRAPACLLRLAAALLNSRNLILIQSPPPFEVRRPLQRLIRFKRAAVVVLIHDLEAVHDRQRAHELKSELNFLAHADAVICHNVSMQQWLRVCGLRNPLYHLDFFDYLIDARVATEIREAEDWRKEIVFAGNLSPRKSGFLYQLAEQNGLRVRVYGSTPESDVAFPSSVSYCGRFAPGAPTLTPGSFGLVWDGPSTQTCSGPMGEYLRLNSPHKASLYLACGMPLICWDESALATVVAERRLGLTVASLAEIPARLAELSDSDYQHMLRNVLQARMDICGGSQLARALQEAISSIAGGASSNAALPDSGLTGLPDCSDSEFQ